MKGASGYFCAFFAGAALVFFIAYVASSIVDSNIKDCELAGSFRHKDKVVTCSVEDKARK